MKSTISALAMFLLLVTVYAQDNEPKQIILDTGEYVFLFPDGTWETVPIHLGIDGLSSWHQPADKLFHLGVEPISFTQRRWGPIDYFGHEAQLQLEESQFIYTIFARDVERPITELYDDITRKLLDDCLVRYKRKNVEMHVEIRLIDARVASNYLSLSDTLKTMVDNQNISVETIFYVHDFSIQVVMPRELTRAHGLMQQTVKVTYARR